MHQVVPDPKAKFAKWESGRSTFASVEPGSRRLMRAIVGHNAIGLFYLLRVKKCASNPMTNSTATVDPTNHSILAKPSQRPRAITNAAAKITPIAPSVLEVGRLFTEALPV